MSAADTEIFLVTSWREGIAAYEVITFTGSLIDAMVEADDYGVDMPEGAAAWMIPLNELIRPDARPVFRSNMSAVEVGPIPITGEVKYSQKFVWLLTHEDAGGFREILYATNSYGLQALKEVAEKLVRSEGYDRIGYYSAPVGEALAAKDFKLQRSFMASDYANNRIDFPFNRKL